jgi:hypothetical protein
MTRDNAQSTGMSRKGKIAARDILQRFLCSSKYWEKARKDFLSQAELVAGDNTTQPNNIPRSKIARNRLVTRIYTYAKQALLFAINPAILVLNANI